MHGRQPVVETKSGNSPEVRSVVGYQRQSVSQGDAGDQKIQIIKGLTRSAQIGPVLT